MFYLVAIVMNIVGDFVSSKPSSSVLYTGCLQLRILIRHRSGCGVYFTMHRKPLKINIEKDR